MDTHIDEFKKESFFKDGDIVLDPFCGSGTTLVQANELGIHSIGIDISEFNSLISNVKVQRHNVSTLLLEIQRITKALKVFVSNNNWAKFEHGLLNELYKFNSKYFPTPDFRYKVRNNRIDEFQYSKEKEKEFLPIFYKQVERYHIEIEKKQINNGFSDKWFLFPIRQEIIFVKKLIDMVGDKDTKDVLSVILCRTARSCRATTHSDLATLIEPINSTYYCTKHYKICKPLFSIYGWWDYYSRDTVKRLNEFNMLRTNTNQICLTGDSRTINIEEEIKIILPDLSKQLKEQLIMGIFSSPPYVGMINYHEQHAYAYEILNLSRRDDLEIGPLFKGKGIEAKKSYISGISEVLLNSCKYLAHDFDIFLVANDSYNLYPDIANRAGLIIVKEYKRPVLNRTEKDKSAYSEKIFHLKRK